MPFDGTGYQPNYVIEVLDQMLELFGPHGEHWCRGAEESWDPLTGAMSYCMLGAYHKLVPRGERRAIRYALGGHIAERNDTSSFADILAWIAEVRARELAKMRWEPIEEAQRLAQLQLL